MATPAPSTIDEILSLLAPESKSSSLKKEGKKFLRFIKIDAGHESIKYYAVAQL
jgi:hypothetical protein